jgi:Concanavalin A-like lectin/glucanases superfamily
MTTALRISIIFLIGLPLLAQNGLGHLTQQCPVATQRLVSYWSFDESSGLAIDHGDGNNGVLGPGVTRVQGILGSGAVSFNNTFGAFINVGPGVNNDFSFTTGISLSLLTKPNWTGSFFDYDEFFRKEDGDNGDNRILLSFQNDNGVCCPGGGGGAGQVLSFGLNIGGVYDELDMPLDGMNGRPTLTQLEDGNAHWILATYDSSSGVKAIYIDGSLRDSKTYPVGALISSGGTADAIIGNWETDGFAEPFNGVIDELRIYNTALTPDELLGAQFTTVLADIQSSRALGLIDNSGIARALSAIVTAASKALSTGNSRTATNKLDRAMSFVRIQEGKHIDSIAAQRLLSELATLRALIVHG